MKKIIFRADGNNETGLGHLYRLFALVEMYKNITNFIFLTRENTPKKIIPNAYNEIRIPQDISIEDEPKWIYDRYPPRDYMIIIDGYQFNLIYQKQIKRLEYRLFYIDDFAKMPMVADVVINHSINIDPNNYKKQLYTKLAIGTKYAILRPGFLKAAKRERINKNTDNIFICFGGSDPFNLTLKAIKAILQTTRTKKIHVVIGAAYVNDEIYKIEKKNRQLKIYKNIKEIEIIKIMQKCELAISSSSNILYELCAVKIPILTGYYTKNQKLLYSGCLFNNLIFGIGNIKKIKISDFKKYLNIIFYKYDSTLNISNQKKLFDKDIKKRFIRLIDPVKIRKANMKDCNILFEWANDPLSRKNSFYPAQIKYESHKKWLAEKFEQKNNIFYIIEFDNQKAALVRFERKKEETVIGIHIDKKFRGRGLASEFIIKASRKYLVKNSEKISAFIKVENMASIKSFTKAGFQFERETEINKQKCLLLNFQK